MLHATWIIWSLSFCPCVLVCVCVQTTAPHMGLQFQCQRQKYFRKERNGNLGGKVDLENDSKKQIVGTKRDSQWRLCDVLEKATGQMAAPQRARPQP